MTTQQTIAQITNQQIRHTLPKTHELYTDHSNPYTMNTTSPNTITRPYTTHHIDTINHPTRHATITYWPTHATLTTYHDEIHRKTHHYHYADPAYPQNLIHTHLNDPTKPKP